ncbi:gamma-glutamylcyclotransferase family protein [Streptomyces sp. PTY087I2]|uniref:gamma-glutamylcyclotransferase family protein n=1 Tax=Streptomyces sp. PTY087I2 TaxID=1819298 RepID=UPI00080B8E63|nr:gamma-glutamylcyclotransferase family protein [Streptomyces sp. PTY087I2]OCC10547.1 Gamma-L-glutamyl-butirosin B gamma-glutamyl cyclotransferase [Streptomyces sp. PTY087I2]
MTTPDPGGGPDGAELPFFVYGTLLPGEPNHDLFLRGRTSGERPAVLPRALLYDGPGYPYAIEGHGRVHGTLLVAAPGVYGELLGLLDHLEEFLGPGHPRNLYERVVREVELPGADSVRAWVYLAATAVTRSLRTGGVLIPEGRWITGRAPGD